MPSRVLPASHTAVAPRRVWPGWPRLWETAGLWAILLTLGMAWLVASLWTLERQQAEALQQQRVTLSLIELKEALEGDLALGIELVGHPQAQTLLYRGLDRNPELLAIDIAGPDGTTLFSTDRGAIGEPSAMALPAAKGIGSAQGSWTTRVADEARVGVILQGPFGETVGGVTGAYGMDRRRGPGMDYWQVVAVAVALALVAALAIAALCLRRPAPDAAEGVERGLAIAGATRERLEACLLQIDENEARG